MLHCLQVCLVPCVKTSCSLRFDLTFFSASSSSRGRFVGRAVAGFRVMKPSSVPCFGLAGTGGSFGVDEVVRGEEERFVSTSARGFFGDGDVGSEVARRFRTFGGVLGGLGVKSIDWGVRPPEPTRLGGDDPRGRARPYVRTALTSAKKGVRSSLSPHGRVQDVKKSS